MVFPAASGDSSLSSRPSGSFPFIETLRVTRREPGGRCITFLPFDKLAIGFVRATCELPMVAERPRFTGTGGGGMSETVDVDRRGRREGAAEDVEGPAAWPDSSEASATAP
jgi:hypothetical protein